MLLHITRAIFSLSKLANTTYGSDQLWRLFQMSSVALLGYWTGYWFFYNLVLFRICRTVHYRSPQEKTLLIFQKQRFIEMQWRCWEREISEISRLFCADGIAKGVDTTVNGCYQGCVRIVVMLAAVPVKQM